MTELEQFMELFHGRTDAYGTGKGGWVHKPPSSEAYMDHIEGRGHGLGIAPLLDDGTVWFAAIDLDEPDFDAAEEMQKLLGFATTWIERSRSGNAHVWAFFNAPIEAWVVRGILRGTTAAIGKPTVEIFPKQDKLLEGMLGNYINLSYHGASRPVIVRQLDGGIMARPLDMPMPWSELPKSVFLDKALTNRNTPDVWRKRAAWLGIGPPELRVNATQQFGLGKELHVCAEYIVANRDENPIQEGHRNVVYFNLAKMFSHYEGMDHDEAWHLLQLVNESAVEKGIGRVADQEMQRILHNAERGGFTSTGCSDPLMMPYVHPNCPIAKGK